jgi:hypothetical protein
MRKLAAVPLAAVAACVLAATAAAKLTAVEQKWASPMISVWNQQNLGLHVVLQAASAKNALVYGSANNKKLTIILNTFVLCGSSIKKAGAPPSPRLATFKTALTAACTHDTAGANDFAKAVGAVRRGKSTQARSLLTQGVTAFKLGSTALTKAYRSLIAVGGKNVFKA